MVADVDAVLVIIAATVPSPIVLPTEYPVASAGVPVGALLPVRCNIINPAALVMVLAAEKDKLIEVDETTVALNEAACESGSRLSVAALPGFPVAVEVK